MILFISGSSPLRFPCFFLFPAFFIDISIASQAFLSKLVQNWSRCRFNWNPHPLARLKVHPTPSFRLNHISGVNYLKHLILYRRQT
jgi:hypothetical protein